MTADDWIVYYSPTEQFGKKMPCRKFTAIGRVKPREPYQFQMSSGFIPWRRDIAFIDTKEAPIKPLIDSLVFIQNKQRWGFLLRRGYFSKRFSIDRFQHGDHPSMTQIVNFDEISIYPSAEESPGFLLWRVSTL